ncbi:MAG TPA: Mov34/MPN/PAD-1 family protein [Myxococcales bacterium]
MPVLVLPSSLCQLCSLPRELDVPGATVAEVLANAARAHPALGRNLLDDSGVPRRHYPVFKNDDDVRSLGGLQIEVKDEDVVTVLPPIAGGLASGPPAGPGAAPPPSSPAWLEEARAHAEAAYPEEACGLVVEDEAGGLQAVRARNISDNPRRHFELEAGELLAALQSGRLRGCYHSHPDGPAAPSPEDLERASLWGAELEWTIIPVARGTAGEARVFRGSGTRSPIDCRPSTID